MIGVNRGAENPKIVEFLDKVNTKRKDRRYSVSGNAAFRRSTSASEGRKDRRIGWIKEMSNKLRNKSSHR